MCGYKGYTYNSLLENQHYIYDWYMKEWGQHLSSGGCDILEV